MSARELLEQHAPTYLSPGGEFVGHERRTCGEHRTVGSHRAWCYDCAEWCYPTVPCPGCTKPTREQLEAALIAVLDWCDGADEVIGNSHAPELTGYGWNIRNVIAKALRGESQ